MDAIVDWVRRRLDNVAVGLLTAIFLFFILQIFTRYVIRQPLGWTLEAGLLAWLWLVFWASAFILRDEDHVRFTVIYDGVRSGTRRVFAIIAAIAIIAALGVSFPATVDFVSFMAIEKTSLLKVRFDYVFSAYLIFAAAVIARYLFRLAKSIRRSPENRP